MIPRRLARLRKRRLTLLGRNTALIAGELVFNAACWIAAALTLGQADGLIGLALLAWVSNSKYAQEDRRVFY
jgi:high-affinity nickel-transport protein